MSKVEGRGPIDRPPLMPSRVKETCDVHLSGLATSYDVTLSKMLSKLSNSAEFYKSLTEVSSGAGRSLVTDIATPCLSLAVAFWKIHA